MAVYLISYDLKKPGQDYNRLYEVLKSATSWWHYLESLWLIRSQESPDTWQQRIRNQIDESDVFLIFELYPANRYTGWLPREAWDWIKQNLV